MSIPSHLAKYQLREDLFEQSMTHRSYLNESRISISNERMEFLGDAILEYVISEKIYNLYPQENEGILTSLRAYLVQTQSLSEISTKLNLGEYLQLARGEELAGGRKNPSLLENAFEALIGAVYLSTGIDSAKLLISDMFDENLSQIKLQDLKDPKSQFQEQIQSKGYPTPIYHVLDESGPDHEKTFTVGVYVNDKLLGQGTGRSKQLAQQAAAENALPQIATLPVVAK